MNVKEYQEWLTEQINYCKIELVKWNDGENPPLKLYYEGKQEAFKMALFQTNELREGD